MAELLVWRDQWLLHIDPMDEDHKEMVRLLNRLADNVKHPIDTDKNHPLIDHQDISVHEIVLIRFDALITHIRKHFAREEEFMSSISYPDFLEHKREHTVQMSYFTSLRCTFSNGCANNLDQEVLHEIKMWFLDHVFGEDQEYANFFRESALSKDK